MFKQCLITYRWPSTKVGPYTIPVVDESRCLGYYVACNGDTGTSRASMLGTLRGGVASLRRLFTGTPSLTKARWWKSVFRGIVGFFAAFVGINKSIFQSVGVPSNAAARCIGGLSNRNNIHEQLMHVKCQFDICVQSFFARTIVQWCGHCFRHSDHPVTKLLSLPLDGRLSELRSRGNANTLAESAIAFWRTLSSVGLQVDFPIAGRPGVRGESGFPFRWGEGWFGPVRDGGVGWNFERNAKPEVDQRVRILIRLFQAERSHLTQPALQDSMLAIES